jgi:processive 1,2-diacylglycerol beta-glucosyltransferase
MKAKPRVLLLSASSGAGHVRAAQALEKAFSARGDCVVEHIDAIRYVSKLFQRIYDKAYIAMVRRVPELMGVIYERTGQPWNHPRRRLALDRLNTQPMIRMLEAGAAIRSNNLPAAAWKIATLLDDPARLRRMQEAASGMARPGAAAAIAKDALTLVD